MTVRLATASDGEAILELVNKLSGELGALPPFHGVEAMELLQDLITRNDAGIVVLGEAEAVAQAVCIVSFVRALRSHGRYGIIQEMFVDPGARSTGIGASVMRFALDQSRAAGCRFVEVGTPPDGHRQIQFYERCGFVRAGERLRWIPPS